MKSIKKLVVVLGFSAVTAGSIASAQVKIMTGVSDTAFLRKNITDNIMEIQMAETGRDKGNADVKKIAREMIGDHSQILADLRKVASKKGMKDVFADPGTGNNVAPTATPDTTTEANGTGISASKPIIPAGSTVTSGATTGTVSTGNSGSGNGSTGSSNSGSGVGTSTAKGTTESGMNSMQGMENASEQDFSKTWISEMLKLHQAKLKELTTASKQITDADLLAAVNKAIPKVTTHVEMLLKANQAK